MLKTWKLLGDSGRQEFCRRLETAIAEEKSIVLVSRYRTKGPNWAPLRALRPIWQEAQFGEIPVFIYSWNVQEGERSDLLFLLDWDESIEVEAGEALTDLADQLVYLNQYHTLQCFGEVEELGDGARPVKVPLDLNQFHSLWEIYLNHPGMVGRKKLPDLPWLTQEEFDGLSEGCNTRMEFKTKNLSTYAFLRHHGALSILDERFPSRQRTWTIEAAQELALKYRCKSEFREKHHGAFKFLKTHDSVPTWGVRKIRWTIPTALAVLKACGTRGEFRIQHSGAYEHLVRNLPGFHQRRKKRKTTPASLRGQR